MIFEQHYLDCLSQASYLIGDETTGRAVVVDPKRDIGDYLESAKQHGLTIELVLETHFHADFLSGHLELAAATGAEIGYGSVAETEFESRKLADGEIVDLGDVALQILHTPGHTPESISIVVYETAADREAGRAHGVLTGDTLFVGDIGRPDLLSSVGVTAEELAQRLYSSIHDKLLTLPDSTMVFPAHGAGSACGKSLSTETSSTIGQQRDTNYALAAPDVESFVAAVTEGQAAPPAYFAYDAALNRQIHEVLDERIVPPALDLTQVQRQQRAGAVVLDTRDPVDFARGHLLGAINIGLTGRYAELAGGVIQPGAPIVLITDPGEERDAKNRLARVGFDSVIGYLADAVEVMASSPDDIGRSSRLDVEELERAQATVDDLVVVDVRQPGETEDGTIPGAKLIPLTQLNARIAELDASKPTVVYCAGGFRSSIAASRLAGAGFSDVSDLLGGYTAWSQVHAVA